MNSSFPFIVIREISLSKTLSIAADRNLQRELQGLRNELAEAREALQAGRRHEADMQSLMVKNLAEEREKRVAHLQQIGMRRLANMGLARGWSAWVETNQDRLRKQQLLRGAAGRLSKPKMAASFLHWLRDWEAEEKAKAVLTQEQRLHSEVSARKLIESECHQLREELARAREAMLAGRGHEAEMERLMQQKLAEEKEKRVQHLQQIGVRRIANMGLARGWSAWHELHIEHIRKRQLLRQAAGRLARPKLTASFIHWLRDWEEEVNAAAALTAEQQRAAELAEHAAAEAELRKQNQTLLKELDAARKAMLVAKTWTFWLIAVTFTLAACAHGMITTHMLPILIGRGFTAEMAVLGASMIGPMQVAGRVIMTLFERHVSVLAICLVSFLSIFIAGLALYYSNAIPIAIAVFVIGQGAGYGVFSIIRPTIIAQLLGRQNFGVIAGFLAIGFMLGSAVSPTIASLLWEASEYDLVILVAAFLPIVCLITLTFAWRYRVKSSDNE